MLALTTHQRALLASALRCAEAVRIHSIPPVTIRRFPEKRHILSQNNEPRWNKLKNAVRRDPIQLVADKLMDTLTKRYGPRLKTSSECLHQNFMDCTFFLDFSHFYI